MVSSLGKNNHVLCTVVHILGALKKGFVGFLLWKNERKFHCNPTRFFRMKKAKIPKVMSLQPPTEICFLPTIFVALGVGPSFSWRDTLLVCMEMFSLPGTRTKVLWCWWGFSSFTCQYRFRPFLYTIVSRLGSCCNFSPLVSLLVDGWTLLTRSPMDTGQLEENKWVYGWNCWYWAEN